METVQSLQEKENKITAEIDEILKRFADENYTATDEDFARQDELEAEKREIQNRKEQRKRLESRKEDIRKAVYTPRAKVKEVRYDFNTALRGLCLGKEASSEQRDAVEAMGWNIDDNFIRLESRQQTVGTPAEGGYLTEGSLHSSIIQAKKAYEGILSVANVLPSDKGTVHKFPIIDNTSNVAAVKAELAERTNTDQELDEVEIPVFTYSTSCFPVSREHLEDASFDVGAFIGKNLGEQVGRGVNADWTKGTGNDRANGAITGATLGATTDISTAIEVDDIYDLLDEIEHAYVEAPNFAFMMHSSTANYLRRMLTELGSNAWGLGLNGSLPSELLGYKLVINNSMPRIAAGAKVILAGDFSNFWIRNVGPDVEIEVERMPKYRAVNFYAHKRTGSKVVDAGTHPLKYLAMGASGS